MSDNTMLSPAGGRRASLRQQQKNMEELNGLNLTEDMQQQEEEAEDQPTPTGGKKNQAKEERAMEQFQLAEMVRDNYAVLVGEDREQKEKVWQNIFDECKKGLNHKWTQGKDCGYLRKSYWPNMKCKALANHGKSNATELQEFVYSFISQAPMENVDVVEESPEKNKTASVTRNAKKPAKVMATNQQNSTPVNTMSVGALVGSGRVPSRRSKRISDPRQHLSDEQFSPLNFTPPPGSRQSSQLSSINTNGDGGTEEPIAHQNGGGTKRRASQELTDLNTNSSTSNGEQDDGIAMDTTGGSTSEMSDLEKELLQARMELCEAKARVCEAEANIQRLEKATWEEMLKKGKKAKMGQ